MSFRRISAVVLLCSALLPHMASGQVARSGLISEQAAERLGLKRRWFTHLRVDPGRGRITNINLHVHSDQAQAYYEVMYRDRRIVFSERNLNAYGEPVGPDGAKALADERAEMLRKRGFEVEVNAHVVPEMTLYVVTDRALLQAINAETGETRWTASVGTPEKMTLGTGTNDQHVAVLNGSDLILLDAKTGRQMWSESIRGVLGAPPAISGGYVFVPTMSGAVEAYSIEKPRAAPYMYRSFGKAMIQPTVTASGVAWPTSRGFINVVTAERRGLRYFVDTQEQINSAAVFVPPNNLYATTSNGYVYALNARRGTPRWRFSTGEQTVESPVAIGDKVYLTTDSKGLYALNRNDGSLSWYSTGVRSFVAASNRYLYCTDINGRLLVIDRQTGTRTGSFPTEVLDLRLFNLKTDRIFIGTRSGLLQCLSETEQFWPLIHEGGEDEGPEPPPEVKPAEPVKPNDTDPFANPNKVDPFGNPGGNQNQQQNNQNNQNNANIDPFGVGK